MSPIVRWSLRFAVPLAAVSFLSACTSGDREQPLTQVEPIEVPAADTTTTVNININNPILTIPNTFSVSDGDLLTLVWSDEFDAAQLDPQVWFFETGDGSQYGIPGWGNNELQYYLPDNASLENGVLKIEARRETVGDFGFTSARINTRDRFAFKYGRIEASIKFPSGQGLWPAFWMLPQDNDYICPAGNPCNWAAIGEIDIVEAVNLDGTGGNEIFGTIHYGGEAPGDLNSETKYTPSEDVTAGFNTYALEWDEFEIRWYFNGTLYAVQNDWYSIAADFPAPFDQNFHILLNLAVGGNFPGSPDGTTPSPATMEVDWVRVYSGEASMAEPVDPGIIPDAGVYVSDPGTMNEDLGPPGGIQNFGSGAAFADVSDANFDRILQVTSGEGYGAGSHVGFAAFTGYDAGFAAGYDTLDFKVKGDAANLAAFEVKLFANPGDPETSRTYDATSFTELGDGWYQVSVPMSDFPTADTNFGFLLGPVGAAAAQFTFQMTDIGFSVGGGGGVDPGITPEAVAYSSDPAVAEDFGPPGGIQNFGSGAVFVDILDDPDFAKVLETTSGEGYGAGQHVGFAAFPDYAAGFASGYDTLHFKVKGDAANLAAFEVKFFAAPGEPETSRTYDATSYTDLGNGWYQVSVPISDFPTVDTNTGFLLGPLGAQAAPFSYLMTGIGFSTGGGGGVGLAVNGGFDDGLNGWETFDNGGTVSIAAAGGSDGGPAANLNVVAPGNPTLKQTGIGAGTLAPNQTFSITFDWKGTAANGGVIDFLVFSEQDGGGVTKTDLVQGGDAFPADWTTVGPLNYTTAATAADIAGGITLQITAICGGVAGCVSDLFIDNIIVSTD